MLSWTMRVEIKIFISVCRLSVHVYLYASVCSNCCSVYKGETVVAFNLTSKLYVWVNRVEVGMELLHVLLWQTKVAVIDVLHIPPSWRVGLAMEIALSSTTWWWMYMWCKVARGTKCLTAITCMPIFLLIFEARWTIWYFHERFSSINTPRYLT